MEELKLPELGENIETVEVVAVLVAVGDVVGDNQPVIEVETEKASLEIPAAFAGRVTELLVQQGDNELPTTDYILQAHFGPGGYSRNGHADATRSLLLFHFEAEQGWLIGPSSRRIAGPSPRAPRSARHRSRPPPWRESPPSRPWLSTAPDCP